MTIANGLAARFTARCGCVLAPRLDPGGIAGFASPLYIGARADW